MTSQTCALFNKALQTDGPSTKTLARRSIAQRIHPSMMVVESLDDRSSCSHVRHE